MNNTNINPEDIRRERGYQVNLESCKSLGNTLEEGVDSSSRPVTVIFGLLGGKDGGESVESCSHFFSLSVVAREEQSGSGIS